MRSFLVSVAAAALFASPVFAEEPAKSQAVRIEADQASKAFVFIIDDEPVAMIDKEGLFVVEGVNYGRSLTDTGPDWIKETIVKRRQEAADE